MTVRLRNGARKRTPYMLGVLVALCATMAQAVQPDEMLDDPAQEARARDISKELRCLVCQNENIDDSNASLARDLRLLVRERITEGDSNEEVIQYLVDRYGEFVLLKPKMDGENWWLWWAGPILFVLAAGGGALYVLRRSKDTPQAEAGLSAEEEARLAELLKE